MTQQRCVSIANADYIQHNPFIPTGFGPIYSDATYFERKMVPRLRMYACFKMAITYLCTISGENAKPFGADEMVSFDIIRIDENGKVAEHWDAMTPIRSKKQLVAEHRRMALPLQTI